MLVATQQLRYCKLGAFAQAAVLYVLQINTSTDGLIELPKRGDRNQIIQELRVITMERVNM